MRRLGLLLGALLLACCAGPEPRERRAGSESPLAVKTLPAAEQPAGSRAMAARLAAVLEQTRPSRNSFLNDERLEMALALPLPEDPLLAARARLNRAQERLRSGGSERAAEELEELLADVGSRLEQSPEEARAAWQRLELRVRQALASAFLRLGEEENCVDPHSSLSCLVPLDPAAVHERQRGSRAAMAELLEILERAPDDLPSRWLLNLAAMTVGEYPEGVPARWRMPPEIFDAEIESPADGPGRFIDRAPQLGAAGVGLAGGSVMEDLDGDGRLDLASSSWGPRDPLKILRAQPDGSFRDASAEAGLEGITGGLNLLHADYDNDGDADLLVLRGAWLGPEGGHPNSLLENRGLDAEGRLIFEDVTEEAGLLSFRPTQTAAWADFDGDGWLDLFVGNEALPGLDHPSELFMSLGRGEDGRVRFRELAGPVGVASRGFVKGVTAGDFDNDGDPDLYLSRLLGYNLLYLNETPRGGAPRFREAASAAGVAEPVQSFPTWSFDFDNDGWLDLFVSTYAKSYLELDASEVVADMLGLPIDGAERPRLYRNLGSSAGGPRFEDVTERAGLDRVLLGMGANFGDVDADGFLDFYIGTGAPSFRALIPNRLFKNRAGQAFLDVTTAAGLGHLQKGHGVSFGDVDGDGDQDLFTVLGGAFSGDVYPNSLFINPAIGASGGSADGASPAWVTLRLEGVRSNRSAIGARLGLTVRSPEGIREIHRTVGTGGSFGSSSLQQEIGLGGAVALESLEVRWPSGEVQVLEDLPINRVIEVREGEAPSL
ncbi:MAG: CRTAC1 family protein [Acidobacteriota bacterium]